MAKVVRRKSAEMDKFLKAGKHGRLLPSVERYVMTAPRGDRRSDILHPSAMSKQDWCPRAAYFVITGHPEPKERMTHRRLSIFDEGHHIHNKWQQWFWKMGNLYGTFQCQVCHHKWWATSPQFCPVLTCHSQLLKYTEVPCVYDPWIVAGHADGWTKGIGDDTLIELKSVGSGTVRMEAPSMFSQYEGDMEQIWRNLKRPFASHLRQALFYLEVLHASLDDAPNEVVFIYESKFNQDAKEFVIPRNTELVQPLIDGAIRVREAKETGVAPDCPFGGCSQCKPFKEAA